MTKMKILLSILVALVVFASAGLADEITSEAGAPARGIKFYLNYSALTMTETVANSTINLQAGPSYGLGIEYGSLVGKSRFGYNLGLCYNVPANVKTSYATGTLGISSLYLNGMFNFLTKGVNQFNLAAGLNFPLWAGGTTNITGSVGYQVYLEYLFRSLSAKLGYESYSGSYTSTFGGTTVNGAGMFFRLGYLLGL